MHWKPNPGMIRLAEHQRRQTQVKIEFLDLPGERIPVANGSVDTVVSTLPLCTIPGVLAAIQGLERVLSRAGSLSSSMHGLSPDLQFSAGRWWSEPIPHYVLRRLSSNARYSVTHQEAGDFTMEQMETGYLAPFPKVVDLTVSGAPRFRDRNSVACRVFSEATKNTRPAGAGGTEPTRNRGPKPRGVPESDVRSKAKGKALGRALPLFLFPLVVFSLPFSSLSRKPWVLPFWSV